MKGNYNMENLVGSIRNYEVKSCKSQLLSGRCYQRNRKVNSIDVLIKRYSSTKYCFDDFMEISDNKLIENLF